MLQTGWLHSFVRHMTDSFKLLAEFLGSFDHEVEGRQLDAPPEEIQVKLRALAQGRLPQTEHQEVFSILNQNPEWISELAKEIKALRTGPDKTS
jgi:hypothetical protein